MEHEQWRKKYGITMTRPFTRSLRVPLIVCVNGCDMASWDRRVAFFSRPPVAKLNINARKIYLFRSCSLSKSLGHICTKDKLVLKCLKSKKICRSVMLGVGA